MPFPELEDVFAPGDGDGMRIRIGISLTPGYLRMRERREIWFWVGDRFANGFHFDCLEDVHRHAIAGEELVKFFSVIVDKHAEFKDLHCILYSKLRCK